jgi:hypothetical protein
MGNKLDPNTKISYLTNNNQKVTITLAELSGEANFPKMPTNQKEILDLINNWKKKVCFFIPTYLFQVKLDSKQIELLDQLPLRYKYRLCLKHDQKLNKTQFQP